MKKPHIIFALLMGFCLVAAVLSAKMSVKDKESIKENQSVSLQEEAEAELEEELGAFKITAHQRELAKENESGYPVLDAGRGNPNWINTQAREAFNRFHEFAIDECELDMDKGNMAGHAVKKGIGRRFDKAMNPKDETDAFLMKAVDYSVKELGLDKEELLKELAAERKYD